MIRATCAEVFHPKILTNRLKFYRKKSESCDKSIFYGKKLIELGEKSNQNLEMHK